MTNKKTWSIPKPKISDVTGKVYTLNGKSYCRVTKTLSIISKNGLFGWYMHVGKKKAEKIIKDRQVLGTQVHSIFEHILLGDWKDPGNLKDEVKEDVKLFKFFKYNTSLEYDALEQRLWSDKHGYAGTADFIGKYSTHKPYCVRGHNRDFKDDLVIGDWKTSRDIYDDYWLQLAAYAMAFYELTGIKVKGAFIAQFRNGYIKVKERSWEELEELFEVYKATLTLYKWKNKIK